MARIDEKKTGHNPTCPRCGRLAARSDQPDEIWCVACGFVFVGNTLDPKVGPAPRKKKPGVKNREPQTGLSSKLKDLPPIAPDYKHKLNAL